MVGGRRREEATEESVMSWGGLSGKKGSAREAAASPCLQCGAGRVAYCMCTPACAACLRVLADLDSSSAAAHRSVTAAAAAEHVRATVCARGPPCEIACAESRSHLCVTLAPCACRWQPQGMKRMDYIKTLGCSGCMRPSATLSSSRSLPPSLPGRASAVRAHTHTDGTGAARVRAWPLSGSDG